MVSFTLLHVASHWGSNTVGSISPMVAHLYGVDIIYVVMSTLVYLMLNLPFNFTANYIIKRFGVVTSLWTGVVLNLIGMWMRIFVNSTGFVMFLLGSMVAAAG